jgi:hypothetical protein
MTKAVTVSGAEFVPLRSADGRVPTVLKSAAAALDRILSGYVDGKPFTNCVIALIGGRWDLKA